MDPAAPPTVRPDADRVGRALAALLAARKALRFYPPQNPLVALSLERFRTAIEDALAHEGALRLEVGREGFSASGQAVSVADPDLARLAFKLHCLDVREFEIARGLTADEVVPLLATLNQPYEALQAQGPLHATLASRGVEHVAVRYTETVVPGRSDERRADEASPDPVLRQPRHLVRLLGDPSQFARELVRLCVEVVPTEGQRRLDAQVAFVDRMLLAATNAIEGEPPEERPLLYENLTRAVEALVRSADPSGAKMGGLPTVDLARIDPRLLAALPQRDLVKEVSSKVKLHQGATTVLASALRQLSFGMTGQQVGPNAVIDVIEQGRDQAQSVATNIQVIEEIRVGQDVDGEYPGIVYAERDRNKNFALGTSRLPAEIALEEKRETARLVDDLEDWRPDVDVVETVLDMLANEQSPNFFRMIAERLVEKLREFIVRGELDPALTILRGLNVERRNRRESAAFLPILEAALGRIEDPANIERLLQLAETLPVETPAFEQVKSFLFLLDKRVVHTIVDLVAEDGGRYSRRRLLDLTRFLCRNRADLLAEGLRSPRPEVVRTCVWLLGHFGRDAVAHLRRSAHHPEPRVRREAARALASLNDEEATRALAALVGDRDSLVAQAALRALVARGAREAAPAIDAALGEEGFLERPEEEALAFVRAAGRLGGESTLAALRRIEERRGIRLKLKASGLREAIRASARELEERLGVR